jgi:hypothetical protein
VPTSLWEPTPSLRFHEAAKRFCLAHAERAGIVADGSIYSRTTLFRAPNSRHPRTGLHKRRLSLDEILYLKTGAIVELARQPEPFRVWRPVASSPTTAADWLKSVKAVARRTIE